MSRSIAEKIKTASTYFAYLFKGIIVEIAMKAVVESKLTIKISGMERFERLGKRL